MLGAAACAPLSPPPGGAWSAQAPLTPSYGAGAAAGGAVVPSAPSIPTLYGQPQALAGTAPGAAPLALVSVDYVSPSAIETLTLCERKWAWSKLDRVPKTENKAALLGTAVHGQHEDWLKFGKPYDLTKHEGEIAQATMHLLPPPGVANVEGEMSFVHAGIKYGGKLDGDWLEQPGWTRLASHPPAGLEPIEHLWRAVVLDHKTGNKSFFKLAREQLLHHPQAPIYARRAFLKYQTPIVELRWNYATTDKKPKPFPSWHVVRPEEVEQVWPEQVERPARRMLEIVDQANHERKAGRPFGALQLLPNYNACAAFGGCPFRSRCALTGPQEIQAHMTQQNVAAQQASFLATIGAAPAPAPAAATPPPPPSHPTFGSPTQDPAWLCDGAGGYFQTGALQAMATAGDPRAQAFLARMAPAPAAPVASVQTSPIPAVAQASAPTPFNPMSVGYAGAINPPESAAPVQAAAAAAVAAEPPKEKKTRAKKGDSSDLFELVLGALCANPGALNATDEQIVARAKSISSLAGAA